MAKAKDHNIDISGLCNAMRKSRLALSRYRVERRNAIKEYIGHHYSSESTKKKVPVNLIALYVQIVMRNLIAKEPRVMLSVFDRAAKPMVSSAETWANRQLEEMGFAETEAMVALDSLFGLGILKVGLATPAESAMAGWNLPGGTPFAAHVSFDDFVYDIHARTLKEAGYAGHRIRVPLETIKDNKFYDKRARARLQPMQDNPYNLEGDERASTIGRGYWSAEEEYTEFVDLWEVYLAREKTVITLPGDFVSGDPSEDELSRQEWVGPDCGPYHYLGMGIVPDNAMPKNPIMDLIDCHEMVNELYRKLFKQAGRQKELLVVAAGADADGRRIMDANDGDVIKSDRPEAAVVRGYGGPNNLNQAFVMHISEVFNRLAGNLDMMGGLAPQSKTLGQDQLLAQSATGTTLDKQASVQRHVSSGIKALLWYWWHDPRNVMESTHALPGLPEFQLQRQVKPQDRQRMPFQKMDIKVDPYSLLHTTPQQRAADLTGLMTQMILPMMPVLQSQGISVDLNVLLTKLAKYKDMPDLPEIVTITPPPQQDSTSGPEQPGMPAQTTRTYERISRGSATKTGQDKSVQQALLGSNPGGGQDGGNSMLA